MVNGLFEASIVALGALCVGLCISLIVVRRRARIEVRTARADAELTRMHIYALACGAMDRAMEMPWKERVKWAAHPLVFASEGPIDERRACMEFYEQSRCHELKLLRHMNDRPMDRRHAQLNAHYLGFMLAAHVLTAGWKADFITTVPSSVRHQTQRGYNPAELIARETAERVHLPYRAALVRVRETPSQRAVATRSARLENVQGVFEATGNLRGKTIVLLDDVVTTGATVNACAAALKAAGAAQVYVLSLASVGRPRETMESYSPGAPDR